MFIKPISLALLVAAHVVGCTKAPEPQPGATDGMTEAWQNHTGAVIGEIPLGWNLIESTTDSVIFHHKEAPGHVLSIQKLTENVGKRPLRALKNAFNKHPYFSDFTYEIKWAKATHSTWTPAFHATYLFLDHPAIRHGHLLATWDGYYEVAYHAPHKLHAEGLIGYERLAASIRIISDD